MHLAANFNNLSVVEYLVEHGGDVIAIDDVGRLATFPAFLSTFSPSLGCCHLG